MDAKCYIFLKNPNASKVELIYDGCRLLLPTNDFLDRFGSRKIFDNGIIYYSNNHIFNPLNRILKVQ
jgi:hypothetical protein